MSSPGSASELALRQQGFQTRPLTRNPSGSPFLGQKLWMSEPSIFGVREIDCVGQNRQSKSLQRQLENEQFGSEVSRCSARSSSLLCYPFHSPHTNTNTNNHLLNAIEQKLVIKKVHSIIIYGNWEASRSAIKSNYSE